MSKSPQNYDSWFSNDDGHLRCRNILKKRLPFCPHDYQIEGVLHALDKQDLLAITATGSGKTGYIYMLMIMLQEIKRDPTLSPPNRVFPADPIIIVISPTTALEENQEKKMTELGLTALAINSATKEQAQKQGCNIWETARRDVSIIFLSPEMLATPSFEDLIQSVGFKERVYALVIDEIHLLHSWGGAFRPQFEQIGFIRARFLESTILIGLTATLRAGKKYEAICTLLGLNEGNFHIIQRSNARPDVQILVRTLRANQASERFPQLGWVLREKRKVLIFCRTIRYGFNLAVYLWHLDPYTALVERNIRLFNSLNSPSYNSETLQLLEGTQFSKITIATDKLSVGVDISDFETVVVIDPKDLDEFVQKGGRVGRDRSKSLNSRIVVYLSQSLMKTARFMVEDLEMLNLNSEKQSKRKNRAMQKDDFDPGLARVVTASCIPAAIDVEYNNPQRDPPCSEACTTCIDYPPLHPREPCDCSGCLPELSIGIPKPSVRATVLPIRIRVTKIMREVGVKRLKEFRETLWEEADELSTGMLPIEAFLPDDSIERLLDSFASLLSKEALQLLTDIPNDTNSFRDAVSALLTPFIPNSPHLAHAAVPLFNVLWDLHRTFDQMRDASRQQSAIRRAEMLAKKKLEAAITGVDNPNMNSQTALVPQPSQ